MGKAKMRWTRGLNQLGPPPRVPTREPYRVKRRVPSEKAVAYIKEFNDRHGIKQATPEEAYARAMRGLEAGQRSGRKSPKRKKESGVGIPWSKEKALEWIDAKRISAADARKLMSISAIEFAEWMISIGRWRPETCRDLLSRDKRNDQ
jgi:hypothetical protein